jgi:hypothetical protein
MFYFLYWGSFRLGWKSFHMCIPPCCIWSDYYGLDSRTTVHRLPWIVQACGQQDYSQQVAHSELGTGHNHPLWESRCSLFIHTKISYEIFIQTAKGYETIGPMRTQGGSLC